MTATIKAFYFSTVDRKLRYDDNRTIKTGSTHKVKGEIKLCKNGLHASVNLLHALSYAPGPVLHLVELSGTVVEGSNKLCASERKYLKSCNIDSVLREFARKQALINIELIRPYTSSKNYDLIVEYLTTGNEKLSEAALAAAHAAAYRAARASAASEAAWSAAHAAAYRAARASAASEAAHAAAYRAAREAAWSVAHVAAMEAAHASAHVAAHAAAHGEARAVARAVSRAEAEQMLISMINEYTGWEISI